MSTGASTGGLRNNPANRVWEHDRGELSGSAWTISPYSRLVVARREAMHPTMKEVERASRVIVNSRVIVKAMTGQSAWQCRLACVLTLAWTLQPVAFAVCQASCTAQTASPNRSAAAHGDDAACHDDHGGPLAGRADSSTKSLSSVHACRHDVAFARQTAERLNPRRLAYAARIAVDRSCVLRAQRLPLMTASDAPPGESRAALRVLRI